MAYTKYILIGGAGRTVDGARVKFKELNMTQSKMKELYEQGVSNIEKVVEQAKTKKTKLKNEEVKKEQEEQDDCCSEPNQEGDCCEG